MQNIENTILTTENIEVILNRRWDAYGDYKEECKIINENLEKCKNLKELSKEIVNAKHLNQYNCNKLMNNLGKRNFDLIKKIYDLSIERKSFNSVTFNTFIKCCNQFANFKKGEEAFNHAKTIEVKGKYGAKRSLADTFTYSSFITLCANTGNFKKGEEAFN